MIRSNEMVFFLCARIVLIRWQLMHYFLLLCCFFQVLDLLKLIFFCSKDVNEHRHRRFEFSRKSQIERNVFTYRCHFFGFSVSLAPFFPRIFPFLCIFFARPIASFSSSSVPVSLISIVVFLFIVVDVMVEWRWRCRLLVVFFPTLNSEHTCILHTHRWKKKGEQIKPNEQ